MSRSPTGGDPNQLAGGSTLSSARDPEVERLLAENPPREAVVVVQAPRGAAAPSGATGNAVEVKPNAAAPRTSSLPPHTRAATLPPHVRPSSAPSLPEGTAPALRRPTPAELVARASREPPSAAPSQWKERVVFGLKLAALILSATLVLGAAAVFFTIRRYEADLPSVEQLKAGYAPPQVTRVVARDGTLLADLFTERRTVVPITDVPDAAKLAFLAAEDARFYEHSGLNYFGMLRALVANLRSGRTVQGGSTITQQVVKNVLLDSERSYHRKIRETILARRLEQNLTKDEIFGLYLNHIYFGHGRYGIEEAARFYFGKHARQLELPEAALLAGIVAAPERLSPRNSPERALERRAYVLGQMLDKRFVTPELHAATLKAPLRLAPDRAVESELAPEVVARGSALLSDLAGDRARLGGFTVTTTLDAELQAAARKAVRDGLNAYAKRRKLEPPYEATERKAWGPPFRGTPKPHRIYVAVVAAIDDQLGTIDVRVGDVLGRVSLNNEERYNPQRLPPSKFTKPGALLRVSVLASEGSNGPLPLRLELGPQAALVAVDVATREVRALVGSYEALVGGLDRTRTKRQPGSSFKPFVYSYALHARRFTPSSVLEVADPKAEGGKRSVDLRTAIAKSDNAVALALVEQLGAANVVLWAKAAGIESELGATPSLALGAYEVSPLEIANAFATFASGGETASPKLVARIAGVDGVELALPPLPPARRVLTAEEAYLTTSLLREVVQRGTGSRAQALGRPVAGKTGTSNEAKDTWFVGYSPELAVAVWVGYDDALPLGNTESGAVTALPIWTDFMKAALAKRPLTEFARPGSIESARRTR
jgi:penicillin-binding protein 1A